MIDKWNARLKIKDNIWKDQISHFQLNRLGLMCLTLGFVITYHELGKCPKSLVLQQCNKIFMKTQYQYSEAIAGPFYNIIKVMMRGPFYPYMIAPLRNYLFIFNLYLNANS